MRKLRTLLLAGALLLAAQLPASAQVGVTVGIPGTPLQINVGRNDGIYPANYVYPTNAGTYYPGNYYQNSGTYYTNSGNCPTHENCNMSCNHNSQPAYYPNQPVYYPGQQVYYNPNNGCVGSNTYQAQPIYYYTNGNSQNVRPGYSYPGGYGAQNHCRGKKQHKRNR